MKRFVVFGAALLMAGTVHAGMKVRSWSPPGVNVAGYTSYQWSSNHDADSGSFMAQGSSTAMRMERLANGGLTERGYVESSSGEPDLWIRYTALSTGNISAAKNRGEGGDVNWILEPMSFHDTSYRAGTLLLEFVDAETDELVWAGWASDVIPEGDQVIRKKIDKAITKIIKQLPER